MKIYPNYEMDQMLKDGTARVISYKALPYRYLDIKKDASEDDGIGGRRTSNPGGSASAEPAPAAEPAAPKSGPAAEPLQAAIPNVPLEALQQAADVPEVSPEAVQQPTVMPDVPPEAKQTAVVTEEPVEAAVPAVFPEAAVPAVTPDIPSETEQQPASERDDKTDLVQQREPMPDGIPDTPLMNKAPDEPTEALQKPAIVKDVPMKAKQQPIAEPNVLPDEVQLPANKPDVPSEAARADAMPGIKVKMIQPETAPGGLIAELQFEGDTSGFVFGTSPGYVSSSPATGIASAVDYGLAEEDSSHPPYINFTCFNRLGLTIKNLTNLLDSDEDFELNIIDCNSKDNSWDYIQSLNDNRIKSRIRFEKNCGPIFAANFGLSRRKPDQYYIVIDSDTFIKTKNWIARFMEVFDAFPEVGLLGLMRDNPYPRYLPPIIPRVSGAISYLELKNADINTEMDFIPGQLQCMRPGLLKEIGYWSEENGFGDAELSPRVVHYSSFTAGFITTIEIDMTQRITCEECMGKDFCKLSRSICDCFEFSKIHNKNESFVAKNTWKFIQSFQELKEGRRTAYCASIHDPESIKTHKYNADWAYDNFNHYIINAN